MPIVRNHIIRQLIVITVVAFAGALHADVKLPNVIGSNMVLQQGKPINIWGWAEAKEKVKVTFAGKTVSATTGADGKWALQLPAQKANAEGQKLTVAGKNTITLKNVLVGEVWLCSGQSNMDWSMTRSQHKGEEIPKANYPLIRLFQIETKALPTPAENVPATWTNCSPKTASRFSAVGYHFGQNLHTELKIPIGLIQSAWGGSEIEPWTPLVGFEKVASLSKFAQQVKGLKPKARVNGHTPSAICNGMIHPIAPVTMRGAIWYQGESNCLKGDTTIYTDKTLAMVSGWRSIFKQDDLSFYFVQIAPFTYVKAYKEKRNKNLTAESLPRFWDAQTACLKAVPNCGMVVVTDITGNVGNIHPGNKRDVGARLARWAMAKNYGKSDLVYSGPIYKSMKVKGKKVEVSFDHCGSGLKSLDGKELSQFQIAGADKKFISAKAVIEGKTVVVSCADVAKPVAARFAWHEPAIGNLGNKEGLPAVPFRTDDWGRSRGDGGASMARHGIRHDFAIRLEKCQ